LLVKQLFIESASMSKFVGLIERDLISNIDFLPEVF